LTSLISALIKPLPLTFRFRTPYDTHHDKSDASREHLERVEIIKDKLLSRSMFTNMVAPVLYDPTGDTIYQAHVISKSTLTKAAPELKTLLMESTANGCLARQELASMLPVMALTGGNFLKRGSRVLDLCASPGSKTLQALEQVVMVQEMTAKNDNGGVTTSSTKATMKGRVVANDLHPTRLESLKAAVARSGLPEAYTNRITYANFDASTFPTPKSGRLFDVILADVPCSGDGTIRKDPHVLPLWTPDTGTALHKLQTRILKRALELCQVGGVVCYSTCSLNPVEDEAVVAAAIQAKTKSKTSTPNYKLVEFPTSALPGLIRHNGVCDWKVAGYKSEANNTMTNTANNNGSDKDDESDDNGNLDVLIDNDNDNDFGQLKWYDNYKDACDDDMANCQESLWPKPDYNQETLHMELCTRLWPQDQDTGGFFVALIQRLS
jgi:16S rRNA C967 or C1407 C5-methylase (RsmB/RsmF family)